VRLARLLRHCLLVAFADSLSLDVVAEGIEQPEQVGSLRDLNCRLGKASISRGRWRRRRRRCPAGRLRYEAEQAA